ncbi:MAG: nitroreductase [Pararhodobacter sp.]|nr:nitroreductase [Pararhodobacter sp.]
MTHATPPARPEVMNFLLSRRSRPAKLLRAPAPDEATLTALLTAATRVPDHGKLEPWRFIVLEPAALERLSALITARGQALEMDAEKAAKAAQTFRESPMVVAVVAVEKPSDKIPAIEQLLSAGAVCLSLVNAALAQGLGACWLTGWPAFDRVFLSDGLGLGEGEQIAGFVHLGSSDASPPERPRPDVATLVTRLRA